MNYATIKWTDIANGEGVRISLFVSGCTRHCKDCFNAVAWDFNYGQPFDEEVQNKIFEGLKADYIAGLSLLGGEPFEPENQRALLPFVREAKKRFPDKTIWCYTGYRFEDLLAHPLRRKLVELCDVIVDGRYNEAERDLSLHFRGSRNQRIINVAESLQGKVSWGESDD